MKPPPKALARLAKLVGMLKSPFEPETESANLHIDRWLAKYGKTRRDLESLLEQSRPVTPPARMSEAELAAAWSASVGEYHKRRRRFAVDADEDDEDESEVVDDDDDESKPSVDVERVDPAKVERARLRADRATLKAHVLALTDEPGANVSKVAVDNGLKPSQVYQWRKTRRRAAIMVDLLPERLSFRERQAREAARHVPTADEADAYAARMGFVERARFEGGET